MEKRSEKRFDCSQTVHVHVPDIETSYIGRVLDQSFNGAFIEIGKDPASMWRAFSMDVSLEMRDLQESKLADVRWCGYHEKHQAYGIGVEYR